MTPPWLEGELFTVHQQNLQSFGRSSPICTGYQSHVLNGIDRVGLLPKQSSAQFDNQPVNFLTPCFTISGHHSVKRVGGFVVVLMSHKAWCFTKVGVLLKFRNFRTTLTPHTVPHARNKNLWFLKQTKQHSDTSSRFDTRLFQLAPIDKAPHSTGLGAPAPSLAAPCRSSATKSLPGRARSDALWHPHVRLSMAPPGRSVAEEGVATCFRYPRIPPDRSETLYCIAIAAGCVCRCRRRA